MSSQVSIRDQVSDEERQTRVDLAACYRLTQKARPNGRLLQVLNTQDRNIA